jgi:hypothetical protein
MEASAHLEKLARFRTDRKLRYSTLTVFTVLSLMAMMMTMMKKKKPDYLPCFYSLYGIQYRLLQKLPSRPYLVAIYSAWPCSLLLRKSITASSAIIVVDKMHTQ